MMTIEDPDTPRARQSRRLERQLEAMTRFAPRTRGVMQSVVKGRLRYVRLPLGLVLVSFGLVGFLPVVGFWMVPLGLVLLAIDIPAISPFVTSALVRARRRVRIAMGRETRLGRVAARFRRRGSDGS